LKITPDSSWLAAGESLDLTTYVSNIETVHIEADIGGYVWAYDRSAKKILAYEAGADNAALDAVSDSTDLSGQTVYLTVTGGRA